MLRIIITKRNKIEGVKMYKRILDLTKLLKKKSFFLFGPRGTGKTTLVKHTLTKATVIDLLEIKTYREYLKNPSIYWKIPWWPFS